MSKLVFSLPLALIVCACGGGGGDGGNAPSNQTPFAPEPDPVASSQALSTELESVSSSFSGETNAATFVVSETEIRVVNSDEISNSTVNIDGEFADGLGSVNVMQFPGGERIDAGFVVFNADEGPIAISTYHDNFETSSLFIGGTTSHSDVEWAVVAGDGQNLDVLQGGDGVISGNLSTGEWQANFGSGTVLLDGNIDQHGNVEGRASFQGTGGVFEGVDIGSRSVGSFSGNNASDLAFGGGWLAE